MLNTANWNAYILKLDYVQSVNESRVYSLKVNEIVFELIDLNRDREKYTQRWCECWKFQVLWNEYQFPTEE